jgi:hypothetical protein
MEQPWDERKIDTRQEDHLTNFIIFCEDSVSECHYFKFFETSFIKVNPIPNQKSGFKHIINALSYCIDHSLDIENGAEKHVWCVFDRDKNAEVDRTTAADVDFDESIELCRRKNINEAWSNDAFELWILLHFEDVDISQESSKSRAYYYARLDQIFKNLPNPNERLTRSLSHPTFSYKNDLKKEKNFRDIVIPELISNTKIACRRAKALYNSHEEGKPNHEKAPNTLVFKLVESLILEGKEFDTKRPL